MRKQNSNILKAVSRLSEMRSKMEKGFLCVSVPLWLKGFCSTGQSLGVSNKAWVSKM